MYYSLEIDCADINKLNDDSVSQYTIKENNVHHIIRCTAEYKESTVKYIQWFMYFLRYYRNDKSQFKRSFYRSVDKDHKFRKRRT